MASKIYRINEIDFNKLSYIGPAKSTNMSTVYIKYINNDKRDTLFVQLPSFILSDDLIKKPQNNNQYLELFLPLVAKNNELTTKSIEFFNKLEMKICEDMKTNAKKWDLPKSIKYSGPIGTLNNGNVPFLYLRIERTKDFSTILFDENKSPIAQEKYSEVLSKRCCIKSIVEINSIVFNKERIQLNIKAHQLKVSNLFPEPVKLTKYAFIDSEDDKNEVDYDFAQTETYAQPTQNLHDGKVQVQQVQNTTPHVTADVQPADEDSHSESDNNEDNDNNEEETNDDETSDDKNFNTQLKQLMKS